MVPGLPSRARAFCAAARPGLQFELATLGHDRSRHGAAVRSRSPGREVGAGIPRAQPHQLHDLPSVARMIMAFDLEPLRQRLAGTDGPRFWRGLEELMETDEVRDFLFREFP